MVDRWMEGEGGWTEELGARMVNECVEVGGVKKRYKEVGAKMLNVRKGG